MKKFSVDMGCYYNDVNNENLVRTICRAGGENGNVIVYVAIGEGGFASKAMYMPEIEFVEKYLS